MKALNAKVQIAKDGPYMVSGGLPMNRQTIGTNSAGESVKWMAGQAYPPQANYALCRCGHSANAHARADGDPCGPLHRDADFRLAGSENPAA